MITTNRVARVEPLGGVQKLTEYLTAAEAADILRIKRAQVVAMCRNGELPASRPGKAWLIKSGDLDAYIAAGSNQQAAS